MHKDDDDDDEGCDHGRRGVNRTYGRGENSHRFYFEDVDDDEEYFPHNRDRYYLIGHETFDTQLLVNCLSLSMDWKQYYATDHVHYVHLVCRP